MVDTNPKYQSEKNINFKPNETFEVVYPNGQVKQIEQPRKFNMELPKKQAQVNTLYIYILLYNIFYK